MHLPLRVSTSSVARSWRKWLTNYGRSGMDSDAGIDDINNAGMDSDADAAIVID